MATKEPTVEQAASIAASRVVAQAIRAYADRVPALVQESLEQHLALALVYAAESAERAAAERAWDKGYEQALLWAQGSLSLHPTNPYRLPKGPTK